MNIVVLTGAGISAESGLGTFRDSDGLWEKFKIEDVATPEAWVKNPELVLDFYNQRRRQAQLAKPNPGHIALVDLERHFNVHIVTQNIDDLHERAGSKNILHLHGEIFKAKTAENDTHLIPVDGNINLGDKGGNGKQLRPHVVWFGEPVPELKSAIEIVRKAEILLIIGTSLQVYPAASLVHYVPSGCRVVIIDPKKVESDLSFEHIELPASTGVNLFAEKLKAKKRS